MPIDFTCVECQHTLRVPDESAGKRARCPQCGSVQEIPAPEGTSPATEVDLGDFEERAATPASHLPAEQPFSQPGSTRSYQSNPYLAAPSPAGNPYQSPSLSPQLGLAKPSREQIRGRVLGPAIGMIVVAVLSLAFIGLMLMGGVLNMVEDGADEGDITLFVMLSLFLVLEIGIIIGSVRMISMKNYGLAMTAAILSLGSGLCCQLALPFGIWAIVILASADVREAFR